MTGVGGEGVCESSTSAVGPPTSAPGSCWRAIARILGITSVATLGERVLVERDAHQREPAVLLKATRSVE